MEVVLPPHFYAMRTNDGHPVIVPDKYISGKIQVTH
jgi:hypothetical protein